MRVMPRTRGGALWRFLLAAVLVVGATAATTAVAGLLQFKQLAQDLGSGGAPPIKSAPIKIANPGDPQTILVVGSDHRAGAPFSTANTDTMLLVRMDPNSSTINVMSVPRDLQVRLPRVGTSKLNAAYSQGGTPLLLHTLQQQVFPGLHVNHIVDVNFSGFIALVNAIHCVYSDVDHRYFNNTALTGYSSINIQPGYQRLCGFRALQFVRFRHSDSDLVRSARQQDFIRWAKDQYGLANLVNNRDRLVRIFGKYTQTDPNLRSIDGLDSLFQLVAFSNSHTIKTIKFPAQFLPCGTVAAVTPGAAPTQQACFVTASAQAEAGVFRAFMRATPGGPKAKPAGGSPARSHKRATRISNAGLSADVADGRSQAIAVRGAAMPIYYPRLIMAASQYCSSLTNVCPLEAASPGSYPRRYTIKDKNGQRHAAYRITLVLNAALGQYYGVQGTTWQNPPLLATPTETKTVAGKRLQLFAQGGKLVNVAWRTPKGTYWISNTLTTDISNQQMVAIAASLTRASG